MEACGIAHYSAREITKLGHQVRLIVPQCVRPFVKRQKSGAANTEAIVIAAQRPEMRFTTLKLEEQMAGIIRSEWLCIGTPQVQLDNPHRTPLSCGQGRGCSGRHGRVHSTIFSMPFRFVLRQLLSIFALIHCWNVNLPHPIIWFTLFHANHVSPFSVLDC